MLRAVLFDLDDTLYAYAPCNAAALAAVYALAAREVPGLTSEAFRAHHDEVRAELAHELRGQAASHERTLFFKRIAARLAGRDAVALALRMTEGYWAAFLEQARPAERAHAVLRELSAVYPLALVSNQTTAAQLRKVERLELAPYFHAIVTSEEAGVEKPDARIFERTLAALGVEAHEAAMVGDDRENDVRGAAQLGLFTVLSTEFRADDRSAARADAVVGSLADVPAALARA